VIEYPVAKIDNLPNRLKLRGVGKLSSALAMRLGIHPKSSR
jgi:hypothetical protein